MASVYSECLTEFTRTAAQVPQFLSAAVRAHQLNSLKRPGGTDQNGFSASWYSGCYIKTVVDTVDKIYVGQPPPLEHEPISEGSAAEGMACRVIPGVSLGFNYYPGYESSADLPS